MPKILPLLLKHGADIDAQNDEGMALLHVLIDPKFIDIALQYGADPDLRDKKGRTPIMVHLKEPDGVDFAKLFWTRALI